MSGRRRTGAQTAVRIALTVAFGAAVVAWAAGCSSAQTPASSGSGTGMMGGGRGSGGGTAGMTCGPCATKRAGDDVPLAKGEVVTEDGVQVLRIELKDHYYTPNEFAVQAGVPVKVVFTGSATDCLGTPFFSTLDKKAKIENGTATIDLGVLAAGTYPLTCGMGSPAGQVVAQ